MLNRLFNYLLNYVLFGATMFWAAGATTVGGDAGGGDGGGGASGDGGAAAGDGTTGADGSGDGGTGDDGGVAAQGDEADAGRAADPNAPVDLGDGRTVPAKWKNLFDAAKEKGLEKEVRALFFGNQRLAGKFPGGINEAVRLAESVEQYGGLDGIAELKSDLDTYQADSEMFQSQPEKWLETAFAENEESSLKAFAHSLDFVGDKYPETYNHLMAKVIVNDLGALRVDKIYDVLAALKDNPEAKQLAAQLAKYYNERLELSKKVPEKKVDAERAKLDTEKQSIASEREQLRNHTVNSQTIPLLGRQMTSDLEKIAKEAGFDLKKYIAEQPEAYQSMRGRILNAIMSKAAADTVFKKNYKSVLKQGDTQRAIKMANDKHNAIRTEIVRQVARGFGIAKKAGAKTTAAAGAGNRATAAASPGMTKVSAKPPASEIDWGKTGNRIYDSEAVLKNGKIVTWA